MMAGENEFAAGTAAEVSAMRVAGSRDFDEDFINNIMLGLLAGVAQAQWAVEAARAEGLGSGAVQEEP